MRNDKKEEEMSNEIVGQDFTLLAKANQRRIDDLYEKTGVEPYASDKPDPNAGKVVFSLREIETDFGFAIEVYADNIKDPFSSVQFDWDFPPGVDFKSAVPSEIIDGEGWMSFALPTDLHPNEGLFGAFASTMDRVVADGKTLIATGRFTGPFAAAFLVDIKRVKMSDGGVRLPIANTERVTPGD